MELSSSKKAEAKKLGCSVNELVFADLLSLGYTENDAYLVAYPEDATLSVQYQQVNRRKIASRTSFVELCEHRKITNAQTLEFSGDIEEIDLIDSETTAKEILKIARQMPENSKERGEMFMKYADLTRKNDAATEEAMDAMRFYFPVKCNQCPLLDAYNSFRRQNKKQEVLPVEMDAIVREASNLMEKARKKAGT